MSRGQEIRAGGRAAAALRGLAVALVATVAAAAAVVGPAAAETAASGSLRVSFSGALRPKSLPRDGAAPISVSLGGRIYTADGAPPPGLREIEIAINRRGVLDPSALPSCQVTAIQPATTAYARRVCAAAQVGEGSFSAAVAIPGQAPYPARGTVTAFNGRQGGRPVLLLHVYGTEPVPTSFLLPLHIAHLAHGRFGTVLRGYLPEVDVDVGYVTAISLRLGGAAAHDYLAAGCPAPAGFPGAVFPLARVRFAFAGGPTLASTLARSCEVAR